MGIAKWWKDSNEVLKLLKYMLVRNDIWGKDVLDYTQEPWRYTEEYCEFKERR